MTFNGLNYLAYEVQRAGTSVWSFLSYPFVNRVNLNAQGENGLNHLYSAVKVGELEVVQALIASGADTDIQDNEGNTALLVAVDKSHLPIVELLAKNMKNVKIANKSGYTPFTIASFRPDFQQRPDLLALLDDEGYTKHFIMQKLLVHRFALKEKELERLYPHISFSELIFSLESFLKQKKERDVREIGNYVLEFLKQSQNNIHKTAKELHEEYELGKPILLATGWEGHCTMFFCSKDMDIVAKGNRGERRENVEPGVEFFKIKNELTLNDFKQLTEKSRSFFENEINEKLVLNFRISMKGQKNGNCTWAFAKMALLTSLYFELISRGIASDEAKVKSRDIYKRFTHFDRERAVDKALFHFSQVEMSAKDWKILSAIYDTKSHKINLETNRKVREFLFENQSLFSRFDKAFSSPFTVRVESILDPLLETVAFVERILDSFFEVVDLIE